MPLAKPPSDELLAKAARLRATGLSWAAIGRELRRNPKAVELWPTLDVRAWRRHYGRAVRQIARDVLAESVTALRTDLRNDGDAKARRDSASKLLRYGLSTRPPAAGKRQASNPGPSSAGVRFAKYVESLTPEQVGKLIRELGYVRVEEGAKPVP